MSLRSKVTASCKPEQLAGSCFTAICELRTPGSPNISRMELHLPGEIHGRQKLISKTLSLGRWGGANPFRFDEHFMRNLVQRPILIDDGEIFQSRSVEQGIQFATRSTYCRCEYTRFAHLDALLHRFDAGNNTAKNGLCW